MFLITVNDLPEFPRYLVNVAKLAQFYVLDGVNSMPDEIPVNDKSLQG
jgi:hypothetical protein